MNATMQTAQAILIDLVERNQVTAGMYVRVHGGHLILGRPEEHGPQATDRGDDRVRFTRLSGRTYGLSVKRHTGRWEPTPFSGSMQDMVDVVLACMQHLVARY